MGSNFRIFELELGVGLMEDLGLELEPESSLRLRKRWGRKHCYMWMMENVQGIRTEPQTIFVFNQKKRNVMD